MSEMRERGGERERCEGSERVGLLGHSLRPREGLDSASDTAGQINNRKRWQRIPLQLGFDPLPQLPSPSPSPSHLPLSSPQKNSHSSVRCPPFEYYSLSPPPCPSGNVLGRSSRIVGSLVPSTPAFFPLGPSPYLSAKSN